MMFKEKKQGTLMQKFRSLWIRSSSIDSNRTQHKFIVYSITQDISTSSKTVIEKHVKALVNLVAWDFHEI
jgi:hypothetical protein